MKLHTLTAAVLVALASSNLAADELDDLLGAFDEDDGLIVTEAVDSTIPERDWWIGGKLQLATSLNTAHSAPQPGQIDWRGLSSARMSYTLEGGWSMSPTWRFYGDVTASYDPALENRVAGNDHDLDVTELELGEAFVSGQLSPSVDITVGRQLVSWGMTDSIVVNDIINPLDRRTPGLNDIDDMRLPVTMTRLSAYPGQWTVQGLLIHEVRFSKLPGYGSDFYPGQAPIVDVKPDSPLAGELSNHQYAMALQRSGQGWDLELYWADMFYDQGHVVHGETPERHHERITHYGAAYGKQIGNWVVRAEAALKHGLVYELPGSRIVQDRLDSALGFDYAGFANTSWTVEVGNFRLLDYDDRLSQMDVEEQEVQIASRISRNFLNERLTADYLVRAYGWTADGGMMHRLNLNWDWSDSITLEGGYLLYIDGDRPPMNGMEDNDRLYAKVNYRF